jgi:hypothetical protein
MVGFGAGGIYTLIWIIIGYHLIGDKNENRKHPPE